MLVQDRRIMSDRLYANAAAKFLAGQRADALDIIRRAFPPGSDISGHVQSAFGKYYRGKGSRL